MDEIDLSSPTWRAVEAILDGMREQTLEDIGSSTHTWDDVLRLRGILQAVNEIKTKATIRIDGGDTEY